MKKQARTAALEVIHPMNVVLATVTNEFDRVARGAAVSDALTEKEAAFLAKRVKTLEEVGRDIGRLRAHIYNKGKL